MPRNLTPQMQAVLAAEIAWPIFLFDAHFREGPVYLWTGRGALSWNGQTYQGIGWIVGFSNVTETTQIQAAGTVVTLGGLSSEAIALTLGQLQKNKPGIQRIGFLDAAGEVIPDPEILYEGLLDLGVVSKGVKASNIRLNYESRLRSLRASRERRFTDADQKIDYPNDKFFEYVGTIQDKVFVWK